MTSKDDQEVRGSVPNDPVEETRHALDAPTTLAFRRVYDHEEGQAIFDAKGSAVATCTLDRGIKRTIHQRKHDMGNRTPLPSLEGTYLEIVERDDRKCHRYWNQVFL